MADGPAKKLARLAGGLAIMQGPIGHQVLGQLLISGSRSVEVAGASVVLALASRQPSIAAQVAVRSVVPAVLVEVFGRQERRRLEAELHRLQEEVERLSERKREIKRDLERENKELARKNRELQKKAAKPGTKRASKQG